MMNTPAKVALYALILGGALLLGGIAFQMVIGISLLNVTSESVERFGYMLMSRGSMVLITAYATVFVSGIAFWILGPHALRKEHWFWVACLMFYGWVPVDVYTIVLDIRFAMVFKITHKQPAMQWVTKKSLDIKFGF